jgi:drug/metabolite transporter (DMT)-like permease
MTESVSVLVVGFATVAATLVLLARGIYLGGGREALARRGPGLLLLGGIGLGIVVSVPFLGDAIGSSSSAIILIGANVLVAAAWIRSRRTVDSERAPKARAVFRMPEFKVLAILWFAVLFLGAAMLALAGKAGL